jgi:hypothetical protein
MKGDIALAGFVLTAEEWEALDAVSRVTLIAAAMRNERSTAVPQPSQFPDGSAPYREED